jgi:TonB-linked SusC/RagA family outer membrane protein
VAAALQRNNSLARQRLLSNVFGDLNIVKGLTFRSEYSFDNSHGLGKAFQPTFKWGVIENKENRLRQREENSFFWAAKNYLTYDRKLNSQNALVLMLGTEAQRSDYNGHFVTVANLPSNDIQELRLGSFVGNPESWKGAGSLLSYFGRLNYNFGEKLLATFTYRADGSSNFGPNKKWGYFPSGSLAWRINQHGFLKDSDFISNLKLRVGFGYSGNQAIPAGLFEPLMQTIQSPFGNAFRPQNIANPSLGWETTEQLNLGLDVSIFKDKLDLTLDIYDKNTRDMLLQTSVPGYIGGAGWLDIAAPFINVGKMSNKGIDLALNSRNFTKKNFTWTTNFNLSHNVNKVVELDNPDKIYYRNLYWYSEFQTATITRVGQPIGMFWGYQTDGIFKDKNDILNHAVQISDKVVTDKKPHGTNLIDKRQGLWVGDVKFKDLNGDGIINTQDQTYIGNPNPDFTFGLTNNFNFGPIELGVFINGSYGADILNYTKVVLEGQNGIWSNQAKSVFERAQTKLKNPSGSDLDIDNVELINPDTKIARPTTNDNNRNNRMSDRLIEDGSYVRLQNIRIGYTLPRSLTNRVKMDRLKVYGNIQNLAIFTNYSGYDPEIGAFNQSPLVQNVDMGRYPSPRMFTVGLDVDF